MKAPHTLPPGPATLAAQQLQQGTAPRLGVSGAPRAPWCGMGWCGECRVQVDGVGTVLACLWPLPASETPKPPLESQGPRGPQWPHDVHDLHELHEPHELQELQELQKLQVPQKPQAPQAPQAPQEQQGPRDA